MIIMLNPQTFPFEIVSNGDSCTERMPLDKCGRYSFELIVEPLRHS